LFWRLFFCFSFYDIVVEFSRPLQRFLWILNETSEDLIDTLLVDSKPHYVFAILALRAFLRMENLSLGEKCAILFHFAESPFANNRALSSMDEQTEHKMLTQGAINPRTIRIVTLFEYCVCLCRDAHWACKSPLGDVFQCPWQIIDGQRLTAELNGTMPPEISAETLLLLEEKAPTTCEYDSSCRFLKCAKRHPEDVFGRCSFDGFCTRKDCPFRHVVLPKMCKFDGVCAHFKTCKFRHEKQTCANSTL
jgi:hypothetical protein